MGSSRGGGMMQEEDKPHANSELQHHTALLADFLIQNVVQYSGTKSADTKKKMSINSINTHFIVDM